MYQVVAVIDQDPLGVLVSFDAVRVFAFLLELRLDLIGDGLHLACTRAGTKNEVVGKGCDVAQIEHDDITGLLGFRGVNGGLPKVGGGTRRVQFFCPGQVTFSYWYRTTIRVDFMKNLLLLLIAVLAFAGDESPGVARARQELERVRGLVDSGLLAPVRLAEAQRAVEDASDEAILEHTLYGKIQIEDLSEREAAEMVAAAERRVDRQQQQVARAQSMLAAGAVARNGFGELETELGLRRQALDLARTRAALLVNIIETARAEIQAAEEGREAALPEVWKAKERVDGDHLLGPKDIKALTLAFEKEFDKPLPVSARGSTAVHRALGFDHTGRIDVAVNPDSPEGMWLRKYLDGKDIPYYAFRAAIAGKATAPHIHIGPGSTRLHTTD